MACFMRCSKNCRIVSNNRGQTCDVSKRRRLRLHDVGQYVRVAFFSDTPCLPQVIKQTRGEPRGAVRRLLAPALLALMIVGLSACSASEDRPQLELSDASIVPDGDGAILNVDLRFQPSAVQLDALEHGVPLILNLRVSDNRGSTQASTQLGLRYFPLSRRYQLRLGTDGDRSFALRGYLLDSLQRLRLPLPHDPCARAGQCRVEARFDYSRLPGALRLPALLRTQWRVPVAKTEAVRL